MERNSAHNVNALLINSYDNSIVSVKRLIVYHIRGARENLYHKSSQELKSK